MPKKGKAMVIGNGIVVTLGEKNRVIQDGAVLVRGNIIEAVGKTAAIKKKAKGAKFIDLKGKVIMPGMINTHMHLYSTFARGFSPPGPPAQTPSLDHLPATGWGVFPSGTVHDSRRSILLRLHRG